MNKKIKFNTLANQITVLRLLLIPPIVISLITGRTFWAAGLFGFSILTDFLDGLIARKMGQKTPIGAYLDPIVDKILLTAVFMTLALVHQLDMWIFVVIFSRDLLILLGWTVIYILTGDKDVVSRNLGKCATGLQMATAFYCLIDPTGPLRPYFVWPTVALTTASAVDYLILGEKKLGAF